MARSGDFSSLKKAQKKKYLWIDSIDFSTVSRPLCQCLPSLGIQMILSLKMSGKPENVIQRDLGSRHS